MAQAENDEIIEEKIRNENRGTAGRTDMGFIILTRDRREMSATVQG